MSSKLKRTRNNPNPVEFKKEPKDEIEIIEETTRIPSRAEPNNSTDYSDLYERIARLESEKKSLANENVCLKLKLKDYETTNDDISIIIPVEASIPEIIVVVDLDLENSSSDSTNDSDQDDNKTAIKVTKLNYLNNKLLIFFIFRNLHG